jgi:hypothetical protein
MVVYCATHPPSLASGRVASYSICPVFVARDLSAPFMFCPGRSLAQNAAMGAWHAAWDTLRGSDRVGPRPLVTKKFVCLLKMRLWGCGQPRGGRTLPHVTPEGVAHKSTGGPFPVLCVAGTPRPEAQPGISSRNGIHGAPDGKPQASSSRSPQPQATWRDAMSGTVLDARGMMLPSTS